jgi:hypothetical protein
LEKGIMQNFQIEYSDNITSYISEKQNFSKLFSNWRRDLDFNELITSSGSDTSKFQFSFFQNIIAEKDIEQNFGRTSSIHILIGRIHNILNELLHIVEDNMKLNNFPMQCSYNSILEGLVVDDLKESWKVFIGSDRLALADGCHGASFSKMLFDITESRKDLELLIFESISCVSKLSLKKRGDLQVKSFEF